MKKLLLLACAAAVALSASPVSASDRYATRRPVVVSPDLSAPWVIQLGREPGPVLSRKPLFDQLFGQRRVASPDQVRTAAVRMPARREIHPPINPAYLPQDVSYEGKYKSGTIVIDTVQNFLYLVGPKGTARRYGVGTGKPGFEWAGTHKISRKAEWPDWHPPTEMIAREAAKGRISPDYMPGGPENPMGARALYIGSTMYRIHGTNQPWTIGGAVSSGCIRMRNEDVVDLYERANVGATVVVM